ncbi:hypothetical protein SLS60_001604 [Paraconiothyrium brasiliense]|uniref:Uncharacterized protein n=1 Tax=Paraconiothyrium brasiliense TaxID=300254 RepID=A0ABR3RZS9_9PLEO
MSRPSRPSATVTKNQSPRTQAWMDPITYGKATRKLIYDTSIATITSPYNQHIRRSLGFRETSAPGKGKPVFASERVEHLYYELDRMAVHVLPNNSHEALMQAWQAQEYTDDVERLLRELGGKIWGDSIEERKLSSNPNSQLLTTGDPGASGDLLYEHKRHREL